MNVEVYTLDDGSLVAKVTRAYSGAVVMPSEQGEFSIQHRDGGIEVSKNGQLVWSSTSGAFSEVGRR